MLRTDVFELIHYTPQTEQVLGVPLLFVPPTINKYYVLDLVSGRSMVEHMLSAGLQVFMMSWRNPGEEQGHFDLDMYARAVLEARTRSPRSPAGRRFTSTPRAQAGSSRPDCWTSRGHRTP